MVTFDRVSNLYTPCHQEDNQSLIVQFSSFVWTGPDVRKITMWTTMVCEEVEIGNSRENVKKHAQKRRQILKKSSLNHPKSTPMGSKVDFGDLQDTILDSRGVSNTSKRLASSCFGARNVIFPFWTPKPPQIETKIWKIRRGKTTLLLHHFFHGSGMVLSSFFDVFSRGNFAEACKVIRQKSLRNTGHGDKIKGWPFWNFLKQLKQIEKLSLFVGFNLGCLLEGFQARCAPRRTRCQRENAMWKQQCHDECSN